MKKLLTLVVLLMTTISFGQTIYSENFGTPTGNTTITAYVTGTAPATFQNSSPIVYTGNTDVRITSVSSTTNYSNASGNGNLFFTTSALTPPATMRYFQIDGINTSSYNTNNIYLNFGYNTTSIATTTTQLVIEQSTNGTTWTPIAYTPTVTGWSLITIGNQISSSNTLSLRFSQPTTPSQFRVDDIIISNGVLSTNQNTKMGLIVYPNPVNNGLLNIQTTNNSVKDVVVYDLLGKQVLTTSTSNTVNVSSLNSGIYTMKITEEDNTGIMKIVIN